MLWALLAAITYTAGVLAQKPVLRRISSGQATFMGCVIGLIACLPFAGQLVAEAASASPAALAGVIYLGIVPTALAFTTWGYALARVPAGQLGISTYIVPPIAVVAGWLVFSEVPTLLTIIGGVVCLGGVALSRRRPKPRGAGCGGRRAHGSGGRGALRRPRRSLRQHLFRKARKICQNSALGPRRPTL